MSRVWNVLTVAAIIAGGIGFVGAAGIMAGAGDRPTPAASLAASARHDSDETTYKMIMDNAGPALVTVKFVLKMDSGAGMGDQEMETTGLLIDSKGLVVCSNLQMGGFYTMMSRGGPPVTPSDVKVLIGDDTEGKKATVVTRDTDLDLAWIRLDEPSTTELKHVDLDKGSAADAGARIFMLQRMAKFFDRALQISEGKVSGITEKPRKLLSPSGGMISARSDLGMPVFNSAGAVVGLVVLQIPDQESMEGDQTGDLGGGPMILSAADVAKATKRALEAAAANPAPSPAPAADTPAEPAPTPDVPKSDK